MGNINLSKQIIHTTSLFKKDEEFKDERFMRVRVAAMHTGINRNNSRFSKECILNAKDTFANIPILGIDRTTITSYHFYMTGGGAYTGAQVDIWCERTNTNSLDGAPQELYNYLAIVLQM